MPKHLETVDLGVCIAKEVNGVDDKGSAATTMVDIERLFKFLLEDSGFPECRLLD
jgi:hypothetical protein